MHDYRKVDSSGMLEICASRTVANYFAQKNKLMAEFPL